MRRAVNRASNCFRTASRFNPGRRPTRGNRAGFILDDEAGEAVVDDLRDRAAVVGNHRCTAGHGLDHDEAERLGPVDRKQQPDCAAQKIRFFVVADLADIFDEWMVHQRANDFIVIFLIRSIDLRGDLHRHAALAPRMRIARSVVLFR